MARHTVHIANEQKAHPVDAALRALLRQAVAATLRYEGFSGAAEVSVTLTDNAGIWQLNRDYRNVDRPTDVLSFPLFDEAGANGKTVLGDIVISLERAAEQAEAFGHAFVREVAFLCVHSMLHLLGYDHETSPEDEADMFARQEAVLDEMGIRREDTKKA